MPRRKKHSGGAPPRAAVAATVRFEMRLTEEEQARYKAAARRLGLDMSNWARFVLDAASKVGGSE